MEKEYVLSFSSFYKAAYAQDMLAASGINANLRKLPTELIRSCGTGLYLRINSIQPVLDVFSRKNIIPRGIYEIKRHGKGQKEYVKVKESGYF